MPQYTQYKDPTDTTRTPSPSIWADCPTLEILHNPAEGTHFFDDFLHVEAFADSNDAVIQYGKYMTCTSTGVTMLRLADTDFGTLQVAGNDADVDGSVLLYGDAAGFARFGPGASDEVWFEARFNTPSVANDGIAQFFGLCEITVQPTSIITLVDTSGIPDASEDFVGFSILDADGTAMECIYQEGGQTRVNVGDINSVLVADTNYKIGMRYRGAAGDNGAGRLDYYLDGAIVQTYHVLSTDNFPDVNHMALIWATKTGSAGAILPELDWWRVAAVGGNT